MSPQAGRTMWIMLHAYAACYPVKATADDIRRAQKWLTVFTALVEENSRTCAGCQNAWQRLLTLHPPRLDGAAEFYEWSLEAHDAVNAHLRRPLFHPRYTLAAVTSILARW